MTGRVALRTRDLAAGTPFAFVSGILNRVGKFEQEVAGDHANEQCSTVLRNASLATVWLVPELVARLGN